MQRAWRRCSTLGLFRRPYRPSLTHCCSPFDREGCALSNVPRVGGRERRMAICRGGDCVRLRLLVVGVCCVVDGWRLAAGAFGVLLWLCVVCTAR